MAYQVNKKDGTIIATVADGQVDQLSTDLTLIGKNYSGYGEAINENFIKLLENFADTASPVRPIKGQLWFDTSELKLKVFSGTEFLPVSSATISTLQPTTLGVGDLWFNDVDRQLYFYDGSEVILLGPAYSESQRTSGIVVSTLLDTLNQTRVITSIYNNGELMGLFSRYEFTPKSPILGYTGTIFPGFNAGNFEGFKLNATANNADKLNNLAASAYALKSEANAFSGQININDDLGLFIGASALCNLRVSSGDIILSNGSNGSNVTISVRQQSNRQEDAIKVFASTRTIELYASGLTDPVPQVNVGGDLTVYGNLVVEGTTTTINTETLVVRDKLIELGQASDSSSTTDQNADGGGFVLKGSTDHEFIWTNDSKAWNSTEHINLDSNPANLNPSYKINGETVLSSTACFVSSFPNLTSVGNLSELSVENLYFNDNKISTTNSNGDLEIEPNGNGNIALLGGPRITGLADPLPGIGNEQDAATREYVDRAVQSNTLVFSMDVSDGKTNSYLAGIVETLAPAIDYREGTKARVLCTSVSISIPDIDVNSQITQTLTPDFVTTTGTDSALTNITIADVPVGTPVVTVDRIVKEFTITSGVWGFVTDIPLPE